MSWTRENFIAILETKIAKTLFADSEIANYIANFSDENKAALMHANGIHEFSDLEQAKAMLQLVCAFARKDLVKMKELLYDKQVSAGVRLDYFLPLFSAQNDGGEDIFVASSKIMLNGDMHRDVTLSAGNMLHLVGDNINTAYSKDELINLEHYVNNAFAIRDLLRAAPNQCVVVPTISAIRYLLNHGLTYRDSNNNPAIVFIPGAIDIPDYSVPKMIETLVQRGANVSDVGFFATQGIVWSIILGDIDSVKAFIELGVDVSIKDEMGNQHVAAWAAATYAAVRENGDYCNRLLTIMRNLAALSPHMLKNQNNVGNKPFDYLEEDIKNSIECSSPALLDRIDMVKFSM